MRNAAWRVYALGAASGALYCLAFPPYRLAPLGWVALLPLVLAVRRATSARQALLAGVAAGSAACIGGFFWIAEMAHRFWQVNWVFAGLLLVFFSTFGEIVFALFAALVWWLRRRLAVWPAAVTAALFGACELVVPKIFPDALGHSQVDVPGLADSAALVGARGLSFVLAWIAAALAWYPDRRRRALRLRRAELVLALVAVGLLAVWGAHRRASRGDAEPGRRIDVAIVQSNLGDPEEVAIQLGSVTRAIDSTLTLYSNLTRAALAGRPADLVVWPETAVPAVPREPILARLRAVVRDIGTPLVYGGYDVERRDQNNWRLYNAAYSMTTAGEVRQRYYKHRLLLLGEYVPLSNRFPWLLRLLPMPGEFSPGPGPRVFDIGPVEYAPLICYELLFPRVVRRGLHAGGEVLLNLTNDYWFGPHGEPHQHLALTRMCALETGRPIVRATNTGISALIDAGGRIVLQAGLHEQAVLRGTLAVPAPTWTPFVRWGDAIIAGAMLVAIAAVAVVWRWMPAGAARVAQTPGLGTTQPEAPPSTT